MKQLFSKFGLFLIFLVFLIFVQVRSAENSELFPDLGSDLDGLIVENLDESTQTMDGDEKSIEEEDLSETIISKQEEVNDENPENLDDTTGDFGLENPPLLQITEIYYDGLEEWIEITNFGDNFSGELELLPQKIYFFLEIGAEESIILTKSSQSYDRISPIVTKQNLAKSFSFTDTKELLLELYFSGEKLDFFYANTGLVLQFDNKKTSLYKESEIIRATESAINVSTPYIASPGFYDFARSEDSDDPENSENPEDSNNSDDPENSDDSDLGGGGMSGYVDISDTFSPQTGFLKITEIFNGVSQYSPFIELKASQDFSGKVFLTGTLLKATLELEIFLEKNEYSIIVQHDNHWLSDQKKIENPKLNLNNSGFLYLLGQSGQVFDIVQVLSMSGNMSNYHGDFSDLNIDIFSKIDKFSPGFDSKFLVYSDPFFYVDSGENDQIPSDSIEIIDLQELNPESITVKSNVDFSINLSQKDRYLLTKETQTGEWKKTKKYFTGQLDPRQTLTIPKNWGFLDKGSCVGLFFKEQQLDLRCYGNAIPKTEEEKESDLDDFVPEIQIMGVLPDPVGKDDKEEIHLLRITNSGQNLKIPDKNLYIQVNNSKKYLSPIILYPNQTTILTGSIGLVNKEVCITLFYKDQNIDEFCYPDPKEGEFIPRGGREEIPDYIPTIQILGVLPNPAGKDDKELISLIRNCNNSNSTTETGDFLSGDSIDYCQTGIWKTESKNLYILNNTTKKYLSGTFVANQETIWTGTLGFPNKAHCFELYYKEHLLDRFCYTNPKDDEYFGTGNYILESLAKPDFSILQKVGFLVTGNQICVVYQEQFLSCRNLPASKTSIKLKNENKLYKTYFSLIQNLLIKERSTLYYNTDLRIYFDTFRQAKAEVSKFGSVVTISGEKFDAYDLDSQLSFILESDYSLENSPISKSLRKRFLNWLGID